MNSLKHAERNRERERKREGERERERSFVRIIVCSDAAYINLVSHSMLHHEHERFDINSYP